MSVVLDGKQLASQLEADLRVRAAQFAAQNGRLPLLATIQVGIDPASTAYVALKIKACERIGIASRQLNYPEPALLTTQTLIEIIENLNQDPLVDGILLQHPISTVLDERACFDAIAIAKDVDGVTSAGYGKLAMGQSAFAAATPAGIMRLLDYYAIQIEGKRAVVVGRSPILGKPMAAMLLNRNATVTICHSKTQDLPSYIGEADIVVAALGKPHFIKGNWIKEGAVVVDAGYHPTLKTGDIDFTSLEGRSAAYTPVPGGVGPMTIMMLIEHTITAAINRSQDQ